MALDHYLAYDHIGIDVKSIRSVATQSMPSFTLVKNLTVDIRYDQTTSVLQVGKTSITPYHDGRDPFLAVSCDTVGVHAVLLELDAKLSGSSFFLDGISGQRWFSLTTMAAG